MASSLEKLERQKIKRLWKKEISQTPYVRLGVFGVGILFIWFFAYEKPGNWFVWVGTFYGIFTTFTWAAARYRWFSFQQVVTWWLVGFCVDAIYGGFLVYFTGGADSPLAPFLAGSPLRVLVAYPQLPALLFLLNVHVAIYFAACLAVGWVGVFFQARFWLNLVLILGTGVVAVYLVKQQDEIKLAKMRLAGERDEFEMLALTDGLTGVYNYRYFQYHLIEEVRRAARLNVPVSLLIFDLDFFKVYNDTFGYPAGDKVLKKVAEILRRRLRSDDVLCRYGGDEFVVILGGTGAKDAAHVANNLKEAIENYPFPGRQYLSGGKIAVSVGVATYPDDATNYIDLVERADRRLYQVKSN